MSFADSAPDSFCDSDVFEKIQVLRWSFTRDISGQKICIHVPLFGLGIIRRFHYLGKEITHCLLVFLGGAFKTCWIAQEPLQADC